jgi:hypothetical protein
VEEYYVKWMQISNIEIRIYGTDQMQAERLMISLAILTPG